jgi:uncharacterized protein YdeI (YjbR/CyaY-like superfamily)
VVTVQDNSSLHVLASDRDEWRCWLKKHQAEKGAVWLVYYKKHTGKSTISYRESVEEALCFGWIDGLKKGIDNERYAHRFTPRKTKSKWTPLNIRLAQELIEQGKMAPSGLAAFERRQVYDETFLKIQSAQEVRLPPEIEKALKTNESAWRNFNSLAPGYRKQYIGWLTTAKKEDTRKRRLKKAMQMLEQNLKLG